MGSLFEVEGTSGNVEAPLVQGKTGDLVLQPLPSSGNSVLIKDDTGTTVITVQSGAATLVGSSSSSSLTLSSTTNQLVLGTTNTTTISSTAPSASRTYTIPDAGAAANMVLDQGNYTIGGTWSFNNSVTFASSKALVLTDSTTNTITLEAPTSVTTYTLKLPTTAGTSNYFLQTDGSGNTTWAAAGGGAVAQVFYQQYNAAGTDNVTSHLMTATGLHQAATLQKSTNKWKITISPNEQDNGGDTVFLSIFRDGTTNLAATFGISGATPGGGQRALMKLPSGEDSYNPNATIIDAPGDTASHTYTVYINNNDNATAVNVATTFATFILEEILS